MYVAGKVQTTSTLRESTLFAKVHKQNIVLMFNDNLYT